MTQNVRWHEDRQERARALADRYAYRAKRLADEASDDMRRAAVLAKKVKTRKQAAVLEARAAQKFARVRILADRAAELRASGAKYGRAKARVGRYDTKDGGRWVDNDRVRTRRRRVRRSGR